MRLLIPTVSLCTSLLHYGGAPRRARKFHGIGRGPHRLFSTTASLSSSPLDGSGSNDTTAAVDLTESPFASPYHTPVMLAECLAALLSEDAGNPRRPRIFVDGTLGGGGHAAALLAQLQPGDTLIGCDVDPEALAEARARLERYIAKDDDDDDRPGNAVDGNGRSSHPTFRVVQSNFADLHEALPRHLLSGVDGLLLDLGVSSHQIDAAGRGFSFQRDGPLDMRMDAGAPAASAAPRSSLTAAHLCNELDAAALGRILREFGDEPRARRLAEAIVARRPLATTADLADAVAAVVPAFDPGSRRRGRQATLARVFSALRIAVNGELPALHRALLEAAPALLRPGTGRLVVLTYHSLEDRATKRAMRDGAVDRVGPPPKDLYGNDLGPPKPFRPVGKKLKASAEEVARNPRARSATLRVAVRQ